MKLIHVLFCVVLLIESLWMSVKSKQLKCEPLKITICQKLNYNKTVFPNFDKQRSQWEADQTIQTIVPLLNSGCSPDLLYLTCSYYAPVCTSYGIMVPPCRSLCKRVKKNCTTVMKKLYGKVNWPKAWNCKKLPRRRKNKICFGRPRQRKSNNSVTFTTL